MWSRDRERRPGEQDADAGGIGGGGAGEWEVTTEVALDVTTDTVKSALIGQPKLKWQPKLEKEFDCSICVQGENMFLKQKCCQLEFVIKKKKKLERLHKQETRWREKKELGLVIEIGVCGMMYVVFSLTTRDFV